MADQMQNDEIIPNGEEIVERFGGIRPMAAKLNVPVTTVQGWKKRDAIPAIRRDEIVSAAQLHNIDLRGLITDAANQNAAASRAKAAAIPEDPALNGGLEAPVAAAKPAAPRTQASQTRSLEGIDMNELRSMARNTSMITTVSLLVIVLGTGYLLFGQGAGTTQDVSMIETRLAAVEQRTPQAGSPSESGFVGRKMAELEQKVVDIQTVIGGDFTNLARTVLAGGGATLTQRFAVLEQQIANLGGSSGAALGNMTERMQGLAQTPQGRAQMQQAIEELRSVVAGLQNRTDGLDVAINDARTQNAALNATLQDISGRDVGAAAMLMALVQLRESADREAPFTEDLALLRAVAEKTDPSLTESVDKLAPFAERGILSPASLKRELMAAANDIVTAKARGEDVSIKDKVMMRMQGLFSVSKDGVPVASGQEQALIKEASTLLDKGDVAGAMASLQKLDGAAAEAAQPWQNKAAATLIAQQIDMKLVTSLMQKLKNGLGGAVSGITGNAQPINMAPQAPSGQQPVMSFETPEVTPDVEAVPEGGIVPPAFMPEPTQAN